MTYEERLQQIYTSQQAGIDDVAHRALVLLKKEYERIQKEIETLGAVDLVRLQKEAAAVVVDDFNVEYFDNDRDQHSYFELCTQVRGSCHVNKGVLSGALRLDPGKYRLIAFFVKRTP